MRIPEPWRWPHIPSQRRQNNDDADLLIKKFAYLLRMKRVCRRMQERSETTKICCKRAGGSKDKNYDAMEGKKEEAGRGRGTESGKGLGEEGRCGVSGLWAVFQSELTRTPYASRLTRDHATPCIHHFLFLLGIFSIKLLPQLLDTTIHSPRVQLSQRHIHNLFFF